MIEVRCWELLLLFSVGMFVGGLVEHTCNKQRQTRKELKKRVVRLEKELAKNLSVNH